MLERFRIRNRNRQIVDALYGQVVERARRPDLFTEMGLADTVMGRFESLNVHMFLVLARCRDEAAVKAVAQDLVDRFMSDVEDSIREIGVGDVAVPKRMRKLAGMFYERVASYDPALGAADAPALAAALRRFALDAPAGDDEAGRLARYMIATKAELERVPSAAILSGRLFAEEDAA